MATLDSLPIEVLFNICSSLKPEEVSNLSKVSRKLFAIRFDVLKCIDHLNVHMLTPEEARKYILRYKNITALNIYGLASREIFWQTNGRKNFAVKLAKSCAKINSFTVNGPDGLDIVILYITGRNEKLMEKKDSSRTTKGINNLHVYPGYIRKRKDFLRLSQQLRDVVAVSPDFNCLTIEPMRGEIRRDDACNPQIVDCWKVIGNGIKGFVANRADCRSWTRENADVFKLTILPSLHNLNSLTLSSVSGDEMDVITINNVELKSFTCMSLECSAFQHIQRLIQLEHLKIGFNEGLWEGQIPQDEIGNVFNSVSNSLVTIGLKLNKWIDSFTAIGEKCHNLQRVKLEVEKIDDSDLQEFRGLFGGDVDVIIEVIKTL